MLSLVAVAVMHGMTAVRELSFLVYLFRTDAKGQIPHKDDPATSCTQQHQLPVRQRQHARAYRSTHGASRHLLTSGGRRAVRLAAAAAMAGLLGCAAAHARRPLLLLLLLLCGGWGDALRALIERHRN